jgi:hypothetical protein
VITRAKIADAVTTAVLSTETAGISCQFIQRTDPRFPLVYFTVDSALLAALAAGLTLCLTATGRHLTSLRLCAAVAVIVSGVVFTAVIAPATPTGTWIQPSDDCWVRAATILMHGVAPPLVALDWALRGWPLTLWRHVLLGAGWPLAYLCGIAGVVALGIRPTYQFLSPAQMGWLGVLGSVAALAILFMAASALLARVARCRRRQCLKPPAHIWATSQALRSCGLEVLPHNGFQVLESPTIGDGPDRCHRPARSLA